MPIDVNFAEIRTHGGSKHRAFEELCFQLIPVLESLPEEVRLVRHGTPDGGVEARATLPGGSLWAWQAKYLFSLEASEFSQMDESVRVALDSQPNLRRYVFCLPYNRPAGSAPGQRSAMEKWKEHCKKWETWATQRGMTVEFDYIGESELLAALTLPGQSGRAYYWFNATVLTPEWFEDHIQQAIEVAGQRYTPELNVELPMAAVFQGLGRSLEFQTQLRTALRAVRHTRRWYVLRDLPPRDSELIAEVQECQLLLDHLDSKVLVIEIAGEAAIDFGGLATECSIAIDRMEQVSSHFYDQFLELEESAKTRQPGPDEDQRTRRTLQSAAYMLRRTAGALRELKELLESDTARLVNVPALLLTGRAGTGKTHLLCDVARTRIKAGQPTILLFGQKFVPGEPWDQIIKELHLSCTADEFLGALTAVAEAQDCRALIFIDAINEGQGLDLWPNHLTGFLAKVRRWPLVGVALSCRTSYTDILVHHELDETKLVRVKHEGFAGQEYAAVRKFFDRYGLTLPDFPLLVPEFQNPLFLKLMCRGLSERGFASLPRGSSGVTALFDLFLDSVEDKLWKPNRCDYPREDRLVDKSVGVIAEEMLRKSRDWVRFEVAGKLLGDILPSRSWSTSLLNGLLSEGLLMQEMVYNDGDKVNAILFSYQRLGDHLQAAILCERCPSLESLKSMCSNLAGDRARAYRCSGLLEALSVLVPERFGHELYELAPDSSLEPVQEAYLESLVWRGTEAFPAGLSWDYLNQIASSSLWFSERVLETLLQIACVPEHPLNANILHSTLWRFSLPDRDRRWSTFLHSRSEADSQAGRIVDWAWFDDTLTCADDAVSLCATTLAWFLTSSNRYLRDRTTKALVALLHKRLNVLIDLLVKFDGVNDPYIAQRLYAVAYGCCLISSDKAGIQLVVRKVYDLVFSDGHPPVDILLRDYARGVVERAVHLGALDSDIDLTKFQPPYHSRWPITAPSEQVLQRRYYDASNPYTSIWASLSSFGDFKRYVVDTAADDFVAGNQRERQAKSRRTAKQHAEESWSAFVRNLNDKQSEMLDKASEESEYWSEFERLLSEEQRGVFHRALRDYEYSRQPARLIPFDSNLAGRSIFYKVIKLGWTPKRFDDFDRMVRFRDTWGTGHKSERIGKKYQWIAFHEVLARIADHCQLLPRWNTGAPRAYDGPWEVGGIRDIDPSLLLCSTERAGSESVKPCWWAPVVVRTPENATPKIREEWLENRGDLPSPVELIDVRDNQGRRWFTLEGYYTWEEPVPPELDRWETERCHLWYQIRSYLVRKSDLQAFVEWGKSHNWEEQRMPEGYSFYRVFLGEYPWHPSSREWIREWEDPREGSIPVPIMVTSARYVAESSGFDCSVDDTVSGFLPSSYLIQALGLSWAGKDFRYSNSEGDVVACDPTAGELGPPALLVDPEPLSRFLEKEDLALVWTLLGEKGIYGPTFPGVTHWGRLEISGLFVLQDSAARQVDVQCRPRREL